MYLLNVFGVHAVLYLYLRRYDRASIFVIKVDRVKEKIMSPVNCLCKIFIYFNLVANNAALSTICRFHDFVL